MKHALDIADAFGKIDMKPTRVDESNGKNPGGSRIGSDIVGCKSDNRSSAHTIIHNDETGKPFDKGKKHPPLWLIDHCKKAGRRRYVDKCEFSTKKEQKVALDTHRV